MGTPPPASGPIKLSRRELEVAQLVADGLTNREIAARLFVSERTVDGHLEHIREKLGVNSRAQVAAWVVREGTSGSAPVSSAPAVQPAPSRNQTRRLRLLLALALVFVVLALGGIALFREPPGPIINTVAGTQPINPGFPKGTYSGDKGPATSAEMALPSAVSPGIGHAFYIADYGNRRIRMRRADGTIITVAGGGHSPLTDGALATDVGIDFPSSVVVDGHNRLYILTNQNGALEVWSVGADSLIRFVVALRATGYQPSGYITDPVGGLALAGDGSIYIADRAGNDVWLYQAGQDAKLLAGSGDPGFQGDNGPAASAVLDSPMGLALDEKRGYLYIADSGNDRIRVINLKTRTITTFAGSGNIFGDSGDGGPAASARLKIPFGVAVAPDGSVFIADTGNNRIREVKPNGDIVAFAGTGISGFSGDGQPAGEAQFSAPEDVAVESNGNLLVADTFNHRIRELVRVAP
ncbi:MAG TPA: LuxR C-terminal-related transcriptional regulator [Candidatus Dormibacteraeota bacterium]|nr:LuxR C-terminal-related transcriptional regulator [Candidatus Dormibacteraeota bacterium]